jgi:transposase
MSKPLVSDKLWQLIEPLIPKKKRRRDHPGRKRLDDRKVLTGILFILKTGIPWEELPRELGAGSGMTCWRRLHEWNRQGVWRKLQKLILQELECAHKLNWERAVVDASTVRAMHRGYKTGPSPVDRRKYGTKRHLLGDARGRVLNARLTKANTNEITQLKPLIDKRPDVTCPKTTDSKGRPRKRRSRTPRKPKRIYGDRGYDSEPHRVWLRQKGIQPKLAKRNTPHGSGLGRYRYVIETDFARMNQQRELRIRDTRKASTYQVMLTLFGILVNLSFLT